MARDSTLYVRQAVVALLKTTPEMVALVPADSIYPPQRPANPVWPFVGYGQPITVPFTASGLDGSSTAVAIHGYAETTGEGDATVPGEDMCAAIMRVVVATLGGEEGAEIDLADTDCPYPATAYITWTGTQIIQDGGDAGAFHGIATFDISVSS